MGRGCWGGRRPLQVIWWNGPRVEGGMAQSPGISLRAEEWGRGVGARGGQREVEVEGRRSAPWGESDGPQNGNQEVRRPGGGQWSGPGSEDARHGGRGYPGCGHNPEQRGPRLRARWDVRPKRAVPPGVRWPSGPRAVLPVGQAHALEEVGECGIDAARPEVGETHGPLLVAPPGQ